MSIRIKGLAFAYRNFVLRVDELAFSSGKVTSIVGPNGAGKTTLLKCISAVLPVKKGTLYVDGKDIATLKSYERARLISYVPQEHGAAFNFVVLDFVLMGRAAYVPLFSVPSKEDVRIAAAALDFVGLGGFAERTYAEPGRWPSNRKSSFSMNRLHSSTPSMNARFWSSCGSWPWRKKRPFS